MISSARLQMQWGCVKMLNDPDMPGLWNDVACADDDQAIDPELNAFLCQSNLGKYSSV